MQYPLKGRVVGPLFVLVSPSPCFRENVIVTCKIVSFLCSIDNFLLKNVGLIVFFFGNQISKWRSFEKKGLFLTYFSHFFSHQGKGTKIISAHISLITCTYFAHSIDFFFFFFFALPVLQKIRIYQVWFLSGATPDGVDSYSRQFGAINK